MTILMHDAVSNLDAPSAVVTKREMWQTLCMQMTRYFSQLAMVTCRSSSLESLMLENHRVWNFIWTSSNYFQFNAELAFAHRVGNTSSPGTNYLGAVVTHTEVCLDTSLVAASGWQKLVPADLQKFRSTPPFLFIGRFIFAKRWLTPN